MRYSQLLIPTLKEDPAEAQVVSHKLMLRAGYIRKVTSGVYNFLPLGLRVIQKISQIVREEINKAGGQEILMPFVQPKELWEETGRWDQMGPLLARFKDARGAWFCLGPTHEEVVTDIVRREVKSYRQLPFTLYQIQTKFRDEIRPRFGLMRGREFLMKDAYSFGRNQEDALSAYDKMFEAYKRIFTRCGLQFCSVEADTGAIGGNRSHEFQVLADSGEDAIAICENCGYSANVELAEVQFDPNDNVDTALLESFEKILTPGQKSILELSSFLGVSTSQTAKSLLYKVDGAIVLAMCRGDHDINEIKLKKALGATAAELVSDEEMTSLGITPGYLGPVHLAKTIRIVADLRLHNLKQMIVGANEPDYHLGGVVAGKDFTAEYFDLKTASDKDKCGRCSHPLKIRRGIEVGHVFYLGTKYSESMGATFLNEEGKETIMEMGCYGIGVSRTAAAAIEQNHDEAGMIWPLSIAPFSVSLVRISNDDETVATSNTIYEELVKNNVEVLYDDRDERPGVKFKDNDLLGFPIRLTIGGRSLKDGLVEIKLRKDPNVEKVALSEVVKEVMTRINQLSAN